MAYDEDNEPANKPLNGKKAKAAEKKRKDMGKDDPGGTICLDKAPLQTMFKPLGDGIAEALMPTTPPPPALPFRPPGQPVAVPPVNPLRALFGAK